MPLHAARSRDPAARRLGACRVDRFVSHFSNRLDSKGRVSIPASFRAVLARDGFEGLYVHPSLEAAAVDCGGNALLKGIDDVLSRYSPYSDEWESLSTALNGTSEILKIDGEGRVVLTDSIKATTFISSEVSFVGQGHKFQIWEPGRFQAHLEEAKLRLSEVRKHPSSRYVADASRPSGARE